MIYFIELLPRIGKPAYDNRTNRAAMIEQYVRVFCDDVIAGRSLLGVRV